MIEKERRDVKVSVIITAYNREGSIRRCLDSVLLQTLDGIEIIVVDDLSTDTTRIILKEYEKKYSQIQCIFNEKNLGPGGAKNRGLMAAHGEYVGFLDSDDYINEDYYDALYSALKHTGLDIACGNLVMVWEDKTVATTPFQDSLYTALHPEQAEFKSRNVAYSKVVAGHWGASSAATKLFRRELMLKSSFFEGRSCDDIPAVLPLLAKTDSVAYAPTARYYYVQTESSVERKISVPHRLDAIKAVAITLSRYQSVQAEEPFLQILVASSLLSLCNQLLLAEKPTVSNLFSEIFERLINEVCAQDLCEYVDPERNPYLKHTLSLQAEAERKRLTFAFDVLVKACKVHEVKNQIIRTDANEIPLVSIVIPIYNGSNYMIDAINSALNQTYSPLEVVVVNDGSHDYGATDLIAKCYGSAIRYYPKENGGVATALNYGIQNMRGEYFSWLSHDDMYRSNKIEAQMALISRMDDKTTLLVEGYRVVDESGNELYTVNLNDIYPQRVRKSALFSVFRGGINGCAMLIHRSHFDRVGMFNPSLRTTQDYDMWFRMFRHQRLHYAGTYNVLSRTHGQQDSRTLAKDYYKECEDLWIGMMEELTDAERIEIDESIYKFYHNTWQFLKANTSYSRAIEHAARKAYSAALSEYDSNPDDKNLKQVILECDAPAALIGEKLLPLRRNKNRKRIVFLSQDRTRIDSKNWAIGKLTGVLSDLYEIIIIYPGEYVPGGYHLSEKVMELYIPWSCMCILPKLAISIAPDIIVNTENCDMNYLKTIEEVSVYGIRTVAWNFERFSEPYHQKKQMGSLIVRNSTLSHLDVCIWPDKESLYLYEQVTHKQNGTFIPAFAPCITDAKKTNTAPRIIVAMGRFGDSDSGIETLLRAFAKVLQHHPDAKLEFMGAPADFHRMTNAKGEMYGSLMNKLDLTRDEIRVREQSNDYQKGFKNNVLFVEPSLHDADGYAVLSAMAQGLPVICVRHAGVDLLVCDGENGFLLTSGETGDLEEQLVHRMCDLLADPTVYGKFSLAAEQTARLYTADNAKKNWQKIITSILTDEVSCRQGGLISDISDRECLMELFLRDCDICITKLLENQGNLTGAPMLYSSQSNEWYEECLRIQQSFSWRVTKPLRMVKKVFVIWKTGGLYAVLRKVKNKLRSSRVNSE